MNENKLAKKRLRADKFLEYSGKASILISAIFLFSLLINLVINASGVFTSFYVKVTIPKEKIVDKTEAGVFLEELVYPSKNYLRFFSSSAIFKIVSSEQGAQIELLSSEKFKNYLLSPKKSSGYTKEDERIIQQWVEAGLINKKFDFSFFYNQESREPELAGIYTSLMGTIYTILICALIAIPIAICSAIYLEEYAPKNFFTSLIEVNLSNLASIPSIVYGLLGLSVLINIMGFPRSAPITAGVTLAMMILPILVITSRQAIKSVPKTISHAALALGATKTQVIFHHIMPLSLPGIATGIILSIARVIGETAPLILIGMVAFIVDAPKNVFDPATVLPVQIFLWSSSPEEGFQEKTSAAIIFLLLLLVIFNSIAIFLRKKYEKKW